ncbi:uncharacterized protein MED15 isoform X2 [Lepeophtheirus salmonis]|uniref:uncharacterized protein MED15 isoform X2 n=1 Tax=Lepeophtheirus salmonis TaxID=72036 RepID=UPI001AE87117|nr:mediator of RNA polymerase II transcription subunit 15-like isoform X2 [Lepeophtheirus salmonis]
MMPNAVNSGVGGNGVEWSSEGFRGTMVKKLEEALRDLKGNVSHAAAIETERKAFSEASNRNEYLSSISKIILAVKNRTQQQQQQQQQQVQQGFDVTDPTASMVGGGVQRPALTLQQQQQIQMLQQQQQQQQMRPNLMNPGSAAGVSQLQARLTQRMPNPQMGNMVGGHRPMMPQQMVPQGGVNPRMSQMGPGGTPMMSSGGGIITQQRGPPPMYMNANTSNANTILPPGGSPMMMTNSPSSGGTTQQQQQQQVQPQQAQFLQSPINQQQQPPQQQQQMGSMLSPVNNANNTRGLAPSPMSTSVVTPHNEPPGSVEDHQYLEKVRELGKYIEPLQRMIAKIGNEDQVKLSKMKRLMDILSNPNKRMPMETLLKCETVLKRIIVDDNIEQDGSTGDMFTSANINPLLESVVKLHKQLQQPNASSAYVPLNHSLQRTLGAPLETMYGPDIGPPVYTRKRKLLSKKKRDGNESSNIPDVLQGEIARLQPHFKVNLDPAEASSGAPPLKLICQLDDQDLPPVPAISVTIPKNYPISSSPRLFTNPSSNEYKITPFFQMVEEALKDRLVRMAPHHTLTQLLNAWEMSVRASCSPNALSTIQQATKQSVILGI